LREGPEQAIDDHRTPKSPFQNSTEVIGEKHVQFRKAVALGMLTQDAADNRGKGPRRGQNEQGLGRYFRHGDQKCDLIIKSDLPEPFSFAEQFPGISATQHRMLVAQCHPRCNAIGRG
jgi:hypothetical protein